MRISEDQFVKGLNLKNIQAFHVLYQEFYACMTAFAMSYHKSRDEAEDIVQEVFVSIWEKTLTFESYAKLKTFLYTSVRNAVFNQLKHDKVERKYVDFVLENETLTEEEFVEEEVYRQFFRVVDALPERCREIFELHLQGKKNEEIATLLNLSILTVKTQKNRAINVVRAELGEQLFMLLVSWHLF